MLCSCQVHLCVASFFSAFMLRLDLQDYVAQDHDRMEWVMLVFFISSLLRELIQLVLCGFREYFSDQWNVFDMISIISFFIGFVRHLASHERQDSMHMQEELPGVSTPYAGWKFWYGISLCFLWIRGTRIFAIFETLGLFVLMFFKMIFDVFNFLVLYFMLAIASSSLMLGVGNPTGVTERCHTDSSQNSQYLFISCLDEEYPGWGLYLFTRTWLQGWGNLFLEDMTNETSVVVLILNVIVLNVVSALSASPVFPD